MGCDFLSSAFLANMGLRILAKNMVLAPRKNRGWSFSCSLKNAAARRIPYTGSKLNASMVS